LESQGTRKKLRSWHFVEKRIKETTFETPFLFPSPSFSLYAIHFLYINLRRSNSNTQVILENQSMINM
jgi:hypothetical protein